MVAERQHAKAACLCQRREVRQAVAGDPLQVGLVGVVPADHSWAADPGLLRRGQRQRAPGQRTRLRGDPAAPVLDEYGNARLQARIEVLAALGEDEQWEERLAVQLDRPARDACGGRVGRRRGREIDGRVARPDAVPGAEAQAGQLGAPAAQRCPERRPELRQAVADVRRRVGADPLDGGRERSGRDDTQRPRGHRRRRRGRRGNRGRRRSRGRPRLGPGLRLLSRGGRRRLVVAKRQQDGDQHAGKQQHAGHGEYEERECRPIAAETGHSAPAYGLDSNAVTVPSGSRTSSRGPGCGTPGYVRSPLDGFERKVPNGRILFRGHARLTNTMPIGFSTREAPHAH